ncbi:MAG: hypothetical protein QG566_365 [Patescibacteria group bacterium]|jgi:hypothetical protein|nr:hypothetical protein [Patescibacteria group bacterium]
MKKILNKFAILAILAIAVLSSCNKENDPQIGVGVGVGPNGIFIDIYSTNGGGYSNGGNYYPGNWGSSNEVKFNGYVEKKPWSVMQAVEITDGRGNTIIGPDGNPVYANIQNSLPMLQNWDYSKGPQKVVVPGSYVNFEWFYTIQ